MSSSGKIKNEELIYRVELTDGYTFRQLIEMLICKKTTAITLYLKEEGIATCASSVFEVDNKQTKFLNSVVIFGDDIMEYTINPDLTTVPRKNKGKKPFYQSEIIIIKDIKNVLKSVTKAYNLVLEKTTKSDGIKIIMKGSTSTSAIIQSSDEEEASGKHDELLKYENCCSDKENVRIDIGKFGTSLKSITRDVNMVTFHVYEKGLKVTSDNINSTVQKTFCWGECEGDCFTTDINISLVHSLSKISPISGPSIAKIYSPMDGFLKISHNVSVYGTSNLYFVTEVADI
jgi:hypothetical protein